MNKIITPSFTLAISEYGNTQADKVVLILPGKLDTKDYGHIQSHLQFLAGKGYHAISFDPPGTWESSDDITLYSMTNYLKAIHEVIEYYGNKPTVVIGHSRGGSMALLAAIHNPHVTHFAMIMSWYSFKPDVHGGYPNQEWLEKGYETNIRRKPDLSVKEYVEYKLPYAFLDDQITYDMTEELKTLQKPKLFIYGTQDTIVLPRVLTDAYKLAAEPKMIASVDAVHDYRKYPEIVAEVNMILSSFLAKY